MVRIRNFFLKLFNFLNLIYSILFKEFINNFISIILGPKKKVFIFFIFSFFYYFIFKLQFLIFLIFLTFYFLTFIIMFFFLNTEYTFEFKETPLNPSKIFFYSIFNVVWVLPQSFAFNIFYNILNYVNNMCLIGFLTFFKKNYFIFLLIPFFLLLYFIRYFVLNFFNIYGAIYISLFICSKIVNDLFRLLEFNFQSKKAMYQNILLNLFINNSFIQYSIQKKIFLKLNYNLVFNILGHLKTLFPHISGLDKFVSAFMEYDSSIKPIPLYLNNHYGVVYSSTKYTEKNLTNNLISSPHINVISKNSIKKYENDFFTHPNFKNQDKANCFTPSYELNLKSNQIGELPLNSLVNTNQFVLNSQASIILNNKHPILYNKNGKFYEEANAPSVYEYSKEYKIPIIKNLDHFNYFESLNKDYFSTPQGINEYNLIKTMLISYKFLYKS